MSKKKYLLVLITFVMFFFGMGMHVGAEDKVETKECKYVFKNGGAWSMFIQRDLTTKEIDYYGGTDANQIVLYDKMAGSKYNSYECPAYIVQYAGEMDNFYHAYMNGQEIAAADDELPFKATLSTPGDTKTDSSGDYTCSYDLIKKNDATGQWETVITNTTVKISYIATSGVFEAKSVKFTFNDPPYYVEERPIGDLGGEKKSDMMPGTCPEYLIPTSNRLNGRWIDPYDDESGWTEERIRTEKIIVGTTNMNYYKKSKEQKEKEAKEVPETLAQCTYYRGNNYIRLDITKGTYEDTKESYYKTYAYYFEGLKTTTGSKKEATVDQSAIDVIKEASDKGAANPCKAFPYINVTSGAELTGDTMNFEFVSEVTEPKKTFKYFRIALDDSEATKIKNEMAYAKDILSTIIGVMGNTSLTSEQRDAQIRQYIFDKAQANGPQEIQNLASFLQDGGKVSKAIYDYATYWYALTSTYSGLVVRSESCDSSCADYDATADSCVTGQQSCQNDLKCINSDCLRFVAKNFGNYIENNVRAGYIPIPDGCDMLSNDLISFLGWVLRIIRYGAIVITVVLGMTDFIGAITQDDDKAFKKAGGRFFKRVIAVIFIFISALFVQFVLVNYALPGIGEDEIDLCDITKYAAEADAD